MTKRNNTIQTSIRLPKELYEKVKKQAKFSERSINHYFIIVLREHIKIQELRERENDK